MAGLEVDVLHVDAEGPPRSREDPKHYVERMAQAKAKAAVHKLAPARPWVIAADTVVVADGARILGKPCDRRDARRMLQLLMDRSHHVLTAVCVTRASGPRRLCTVDTQVTFGQADAREIDQYLRTNEWRDKAGAYAVQGHAGARFVTRIVGSFTNVIGLPTTDLLESLKFLDVL